jgi:hypothetical protein
MNTFTNPEALRVFASTPCWCYGPEDMAVLKDPLRLHRYEEVYTDVIAPSNRAFVDVTMRGRHLCDFPNQKALASVFVLSGLDLSTAAPVGNWFNMQIVHAEAWTPLLKRFASDESILEATTRAEWTRASVGVMGCGRGR